MPPFSSQNIRTLTSPQPKPVSFFGNLSSALDKYRGPALNLLLQQSKPNMSTLNGPVYVPPPTPSQIDLSKIQPVSPITDIITENTPTSTIDVNGLDSGIASNTPTTDLTGYNDESAKLRAEIKVIEDRLSGSADEREQMLRDKGVFDDVKKLNELKLQLKTAEDRKIEIPLETQMKLRGSGATLREFQNAINAPLESNALDVLASTRLVDSQTNVVNTNLALVNDYFTQRNAADQFAFQQKQARLNAIDQAYAGVMSEQQKNALEEKKFQNDVALKQMDYQNDLMKDAISSAIKNGVDMSRISRVLGSGGDIADIYSLGSPVAEQAKEDTNLTIQNRIDLIDSLLNNEDGLAANVGATWFNRGISPFGGTGKGGILGTILGAGVIDYAQGDVSKFKTDMENFLSKETLGKFLELKNQGATFGAMSESEWKIIQDSATALGSIGDGRSNLSEKEFKARLNDLKKGSMKVFIRNNMTQEQYNALGLKNEQSFDKVLEMYKKIKDRQPQSNGVDYAAQDISANLAPTFDLIKNQEGFSATAYPDGGRYSIGYGTQSVGGKPVVAGQTITKEQAAEETLSQIINNYTSFADKLKNTITPNQFAALASFEYNLGSGVWNDTTGKKILALVDSGKYDQAGSLMRQYNKSRQNGTLVVNPVLQQRRATEMQYLLS